MFPMQRTRPDHPPSLVRRERPLNTLSKVRQSVVVLVYFTDECLHAVPPKRSRSEEQWERRMDYVHALSSWSVDGQRREEHTFFMLNTYNQFRLLSIPAMTVRV